MVYKPLVIDTVTNRISLLATAASTGQDPGYGYWKAPVSVIQRADMTLSGWTAQLQIDGIYLTQGERVLYAPNSADNVNAGIYVVSTGAWQRASDADSVAKLPAGTCVLVKYGTTYGPGIAQLQGAPTTLGVSAQTWALQAYYTAVTAPLTSLGGNLAVPLATTTRDGFISSIDWNRFDAAATTSASAVPTTRTISTTAPLTGGGDLSANRTLAVTVGSATNTVCAGNDARLSDDRVTSAIRTASAGTVTISTVAPTATQVLTASSGTAASWQTPSVDVPATRALTTTAPLTIGGGTSADLSANRTLAMPASTTATDGYMTATQATALSNAVPTSRVITAAPPLTIAASSAANLAADRTIAISPTPSFTSVTTGLFLAGTMYDWGATNAVSHNVTTQANDFAVGPITGTLSVTLAGGVAGRQGTFVVRQNASTAYGMTVSPTGFTLVKDASLANYNPSTTLSSFTIYSYYFVVCGGSSICILGRLALA